MYTFIVHTNTTRLYIFSIRIYVRSGGPGILDYKLVTKRTTTETFHLSHEKVPRLKQKKTGFTRTAVFYKGVLFDFKILTLLSLY